MMISEKLPGEKEFFIKNNKVIQWKFYEYPDCENFYILEEVHKKYGIEYYQKCLSTNVSKKIDIDGQFFDFLKEHINLSKKYYSQNETLYDLIKCIIGNHKCYYVPKMTWKCQFKNLYLEIIFDMYKDNSKKNIILNVKLDEQFSSKLVTSKQLLSWLDKNKTKFQITPPPQIILPQEHKEPQEYKEHQEPQEPFILGHRRDVNYINKLLKSMSCLFIKYPRYKRIEYQTCKITPDEFAYLNCGS